ncbi:MAG TPA: glycosyltransferase family 2 protein [Pyrinomonadaceae bacterium]|nr:glycosyltransferase family 2 protein [Pyrinomonadaceae bacterium]
MSAEPIRVEIVAPVHNRKDITLQCLKSLSRIDTEGMNVGVVIVDDGSTDGTAEAVRSAFPDVDIVRGDGSLWFTEGTNAGIRHALARDPKYFLLMNDDQVFDSRFLTFLVETAEANPRSVIGPLLLLWDAPHRLFQTSPVWETMSGGWRHWYSQTVWTVPHRPWKVDLIVGNCLLVPAEAINECGLMDSKRYPNFGDAEFTPRLRKANWNLIIDPRSRVFCQPNISPSRVRNMGIRRAFQDLIVDLKSTHNLRRRLYANLDGAPTRLQGLMAFVMFFLLTLSGRNSERQDWAETQHEKPLSDTFASAVLPK